MPVSFDCTLFQRTIWQMRLLGLGKDEIQEMIEEDGKAEAHCHFCNEKYHLFKRRTRRVYLKESKVILIKYRLKKLGFLIY